MIFGQVVKSVDSQSIIPQFDPESRILFINYYSGYKMLEICTLDFQIEVALRILILTILSQGYAVIRDPMFINFNDFSVGLPLFDA